MLQLNKLMGGSWTTGLRGIMRPTIWKQLFIFVCTTVIPGYWLATLSRPFLHPRFRPAYWT